MCEGLEIVSHLCAEIRLLAPLLSDYASFFSDLSTVTSYDLVKILFRLAESYVVLSAELYCSSSTSDYRVCFDDE